MKATKSKPVSKALKGEAVLVSFRLQFAVVAAAFITWAVQSVYTVTTVASWLPGNRNGNLDLVLVATSLFPLVVFGMMLMTSGRYKQPVSSLFIAVLKTLLSLFLFAVLVNLWNWVVSISGLSPFNSGLRWVYSPAVQLGIMALTLMCTVWVLRDNKG